MQIRWRQLLHFNDLICLPFLRIAKPFVLLQQIGSIFPQSKSRPYFYSLPNNKILDWSKLKAFADDKIKVLKMMIFVLDRIENILGKRENAGYQHFLIFPLCFQMAFCPGSGLCGKELNKVRNHVTTTPYFIRWMRAAMFR